MKKINVEKVKLKIKGMFLSVTMWFNALAAVTVSVIPNFYDGLSYKWSMWVVIIGNVIIRFFFTVKPLEWKLMVVNPPNLNHHESSMDSRWL